jgi:ribonuclease HI
LSGAARAWIDGAARGNPGDAGFGVRVEWGDRSDEIVGFLGRTTNNVAEYAGLVAALAFCVREGIDDLVLHSDSQLLVRQVEGAYKVKAPHLVPIFLKVLSLRRSIPRFEIHHVPREQNREADKLANRAVDQRVPLPDWLELEIPVS